MPIEPDGRFDPIKIARWVEAVKPRFGTKGITGNPDIKDWELEWRKYRAKINEVEYYIRLGNLIPRAEVEGLLVERAV